MLTGEREALEGFYTHRRIVELEFDPVRGSFDSAHLQEINRRIFQDLPGAGFSNVQSGEFQSPTPKGRDWMKHRMLSTVKGSFYVACMGRLQGNRDLPDLLRDAIRASQ